MIVNSTAAGIDLVGAPATRDSAGRPRRRRNNGTIDRRQLDRRLDAAGTALQNGVAVTIGDAQETVIGGDKPTG